MLCDVDCSLLIKILHIYLGNMENSNGKEKTRENSVNSGTYWREQKLLPLADPSKTI